MTKRLPPTALEPSSAMLHPADAGTEAIVAFLSSRKAYGPGVGAVEVKETHKSWVFLCGEDVYKLKKPVRNHLQDLSTLEARQENALSEVRLNRRLANDIYLGVKALTRSTSGALAIAGEGEVVDWLVHMRRVPEACLLDQMIASGEVSGESIDALIGVLADFYQGIEPAAITPSDYVQGFIGQQNENRRILTMGEFALDHAETTRLLDSFDVCVSVCKPLLEHRVECGAVVEGHGDLRPEHVCLLDQPVIIDCLEFSKDLRIVDPYDEITYLGLECSLLGAPQIKGQLIHGYAARTGDACPPELLSFYEFYRALLRARLCLAHLLDPGPQHEEKWLQKTNAYIAAANRALVSLETQ